VLSRRHSTPSSAVNVVGNPFVSCLINLPIGPKQAMDVAQQQQHTYTSLAVNLSTSCEMVQVPASAAVIAGDPFKSFGAETCG
jgi:hypothetical protein